MTKLGMRSRAPARAPRTSNAPCAGSARHRRPQSPCSEETHLRCGTRPSRLIETHAVRIGATESISSNSCAHRQSPSRWEQIRRAQCAPNIIYDRSSIANASNLTNIRHEIRLLWRSQQWRNARCEKFTITLRNRSNASTRSIHNVLARKK